MSTVRTWLYEDSEGRSSRNSMRSTHMPNDKCSCTQKGPLWYVICNMCMYKDEMKYKLCFQRFTIPLISCRWNNFPLVASPTWRNLIQLDRCIISVWYVNGPLLDRHSFSFVLTELWTFYLTLNMKNISPNYNFLSSRSTLFKVLAVLKDSILYNSTIISLWLLRLSFIKKC